MMRNVVGAVLRAVQCLVVVVVAVVVVAVGCNPTVTIPNDAQILCAADTDCPSGHGLVCDKDAGQCVPNGATIDRAPPFLTDSSVDTDVVGEDETANVVLVANELLDGNPRVTYLRGDTEVDVPVEPLANAAGGTYVAHVTPSIADGDTSGPITISATLVDQAGNETAVDRVPVDLAFDVDAPRAQNAQANVVADGRNPLFPGAPFAIRADSGLVVDVFFDEPVKDAVLTVKDVDGNSVATITNVLGEGLDHAHFQSIGAVAPDAADGPIDLVITCSDFHNNAFDGSITASVSSGALLVDNTPPPPPDFQILARTPWQSVTASPATHAFGATLGGVDSLLVFLLPEGVGVVDNNVPVSVARAGAAGGEFVFDLPIDVPAATAVAVDAAGNASAPASATQTTVVASVLDPTSPHRVLARPVFRDALLQGADTDATADVRGGDAVVDAAPFWRPLTTQVLDVPLSPIAAYDPVNDAVVLVDDGATFLVQGPNVVRTTAPTIAIRDGAAMALDEARGVVVLFGGHAPDFSTSNATFEWDGERWTEVLAHDAANSDGVVRPPPRLGHAMTYSRSLGGVVVVDGCRQDDRAPESFGCLGGRNDIWVWDGATWTAQCGAAGVPDCGQGPTFNNNPGLGVDGLGRLVAVGGNPAGGFGIGFPPGTPLVAVFNEATHTWDHECGSGAGFPCELLPGDPAAVRFDAFGDGQQELAFIAPCVGSTGQQRPTCLTVYSGAGDSAALDVITLDDSLQHALGKPTFQPPALAATPSGALLEYVVFDQGGVLQHDVVETRANRRDAIAPSSVDAGCGANAFVDDAAAAGPATGGGGVVLAGGCSICADLNGGAMSCNTPRAASSVLRVDDVAASVRALPVSNDPQGGAQIAVLGDGSVVAVFTVDGDGPFGGDAGTTGIGAAAWVEATSTWAYGPAALFEVGIADLQPNGIVADPDDPQRAILFSTGLGASLDRTDAVSSTAAITPLCRSDVNVHCSGTSPDDAADTVPVGTAFLSSPPTLFGGFRTTQVIVDFTETIANATRAPIDVDGPSPQPRGHAGLAADDDRDVVWMFGGTASPPQQVGGSSFSCGFGGPPECGDVWMFDPAAATWTEAHPVDVFARVGRPAPRVVPAMASSAGGFVMTAGGTALATNIFTAANDAWKLEASSTTAPAHLFATDLSAMGSDAAGAPSSLHVLWCGAAEDAGGAAVDVVMDVWAGRGFVPLNNVAAAAGVVGPGGSTCVKGDAIDAPDITFAARTAARVIFVAVRPDAAHNGVPVGAGFASLTTTALEVTAQF